MTRHSDITNRIDVFLDDDPEPLASYRPPLRFELDTSQLEDGPHALRVEAYDSSGNKGLRVVPFTVRNGPGISISGLGANDVLEGKIPILVNAYGGANEPFWEPSRAETPAPIPTWTWVLLIIVVAFGGFYGVRQWRPPATFASTSSHGGTSEVAASPVAGSGHTCAPKAAGKPSATPADAALGAQVFGSHCASCHQPTGQGLPGVFPSLAGDPVVTADDPTNHIGIVLNGLHGKTIGGVSYASPMPAFGARLSDEEIAAVVNHERSNWGNNAPLVRPEDVQQLRTK